MTADWNADAAADPPVTVDGPHGPVTVSRAVWEDSDVLHHVRREADEARRLFGDAAEASGDLEGGES